MTFLTSAFRLFFTATGICLLAGAYTAAQAQGPGSGGPGPGTPPVTPTETPIDGGASLLLAAGAAYGLKRLRNARRAKAQ